VQLVLNDCDRKNSRARSRHSTKISWLRTGSFLCTRKTSFAHTRAWGQFRRWYQWYCVSSFMRNNLTSIIITLFKSLVVVAERECSTNWGDCKPNKSNQTVSNSITDYTVQIVTDYTVHICNMSSNTTFEWRNEHSQFSREISRL